MASTNPFQSYPRSLARLPRIARLFVLHSAIGFVLSAIFTVAVLWLDIAGIGHLVTHVKGGWIMGFVFFVLNGIVFASVQTAIVVMTMDYDDNDS